MNGVRETLQNNYTYLIETTQRIDGTPTPQVAIQQNFESPQTPTVIVLPPGMAVPNPAAAAADSAGNTLGLRSHDRKKLYLQIWGMRK
jgi:hypothetical protein